MARSKSKPKVKPKRTKKANTTALVAPQSKFYHYSQNNSGGQFQVTDGLTVHVVIEADSNEEADRIGQDLGMYWDGCDSGRDCSCCGDRWHPYYGKGGDSEPLVYGMTPKEYVSSHDSLLWMKKGKNVVVHYKNGIVQWF